MLSRALMWDNSSCVDTFQVWSSLWINNQSHQKKKKKQNYSNTDHLRMLPSQPVAKACRLTLSMDASLRNSIKSSLSLLWFSSNTSKKKKERKEADQSGHVAKPGVGKLLFDWWTTTRSKLVDKQRFYNLLTVNVVSSSSTVLFKKLHMALGPQFAHAWTK